MSLFSIASSLLSIGKVASSVVDAATQANQQSKPKSGSLDDLWKQLDSGDIRGAKDTLSSIENGFMKHFGITQSNAKDSPLYNDFQNILNSLNARDLDGAKRAFNQLQTDVKSQEASVRGGIDIRV